MSDTDTNEQAPARSGSKSGDTPAQDAPETRHVVSGGAPIIQGDNIDIRRGGGTILTARQDMTITEGGGSVLVFALVSFLLRRGARRA